jgi:hypothetical protein
MVLPRLHAWTFCLVSWKCRPDLEVFPGFSETLWLLPFMWAFCSPAKLSVLTVLGEVSHNVYFALHLCSSYYSYCCILRVSFPAVLTYTKGLKRSSKLIIIIAVPFCLASAWPTVYIQMYLLNEWLEPILLLFLPNHCQKISFSCSALTISNIQAGSTGNWGCHVQTKRGNNTRTVDIVVLESSAQYCPPERVVNNKGDFRSVTWKVLVKSDSSQIILFPKAHNGLPSSVTKLEK